MARFFADSAGQIIAFRANIGEEESPDYTDPPAGTVYFLQFDEATNPGIITDYSGDSQAFSMVGGTLTKNSTPVTINPDTAAYAGFRNWRDFLVKLNSTNDPISRGEFAQALSLLFRDARRTL
jgi:hypothetical protein